MKNIMQVTTHFIRYTCLSRTVLNPSWYRFNKVLKTFLRLTWQHLTVATDLLAAHPWCKFPVQPHSKCTVLNWVCLCVSTVNSMSCSRNHSEIICVLWHNVLSCQKQILENGNAPVMVINNYLSRVLLCLNEACSAGMKLPKVCYPSHHYITISSNLNYWYKEQ